MKRILTLILALALLLPLSACHSAEYEAVERELEALREENEAKAREAAAAAEAAAEDVPNPNDRPDWGDVTLPSAAGTKRAPVNDWDGILSSEYELCENRFYYNLQSFRTIPSPYGGSGHNRGALVVHYYTDLVTLDTNSVCPDPLCRHDDLFTCMYTEFGSSAPYCAVGNDYFYVVRKEYGTSLPKFYVYKMDLNTNKAKKVYDPIDVMPGIIGEEGGVVYIYDSKTTLDMEGKTAAREEYILGLSVETDEVLFKRTIPEDCGVHFIRGGKILCSSSKSLIECDMNFENRRTLFDYAGLGSLATWYYDENTDEFWFSVIRQNAETGRIFKITADGESEEIRLPSEKICYFQLTNSKIYYTVYEPRLLGDHPTDPNGAVDYSGGKIWAVSRDNPGEDPAVVYDTEGKYLLCRPGLYTYTIFGDQLFFPVAEIVREVHDGQVITYISVAGDVPMAHIDLTTGEEEIIRFE